jgi:hypothetical protein
MWANLYSWINAHWGCLGILTGCCLGAAMMAVVMWRFNKARDCHYGDWRDSFIQKIKPSKEEGPK